MDRTKLKNLAKKRLKNRVIISFALILLIQFAFAVLGIIPFIGWVATILFSGPIILSLSWMFYRMVVKNKTPDIEDLMHGFSDDNFIRSLVAFLLVNILTFLWSLLLIIPGIIKAIAYSQIYFIMIEHPGMDASVALEKSKRIMYGHKMDYFILRLSFIPWYLLVGITFGIAYIWVGPYVEATKVAFYKSITSPSAKAKTAIKKLAADVKQKTSASAKSKS